ncbi:hypothetical protein [Evansella halocellulosilytica]|uniref:hypothetical protein n=1 Tax=Evansella halocellulosilytica TaxID=2011013 RepID=UPI001C546735|nr:hypothetical protein [Evansella halocellulosilytica]
MMADYKYRGLTAYIKENELNAEKLNVLASAIESVQHQVETIEFDEEKYKTIVRSEAYQYLYDNDSMCLADDSEFPENTPEAYKRLSIEGTNIKGYPMLKIYIPSVSKRIESVHHFIYNSLRPVLLELFGEDLIHMVMKESVEYENFKDGKETILVSVEDRTKVPA